MKNNCLKRHFGLIHYNLLNASRFNADNLQHTISWRSAAAGSQQDWYFPIPMCGRYSRQSELREWLCRTGGKRGADRIPAARSAAIRIECHYIQVGTQLKRSAGCTYFKIQWRTFSEETFISLVNSHEKFTFWQRCVCLVFYFSFLFFDTKPNHFSISTWESKARCIHI